jgi:hypothetical protein
VNSTEIRRIRGIFTTPHSSIKSPSGESDKSVYLF